MSARHLSCEEVMERLFAFLDGEIDGATSADIDRHLERCRECFSRAEFEKHLRERIAGAGTTKAPDRLRRRIKDILDEF